MDRRKSQEKASGKLGSKSRPKGKDEPDWAEGLRKLYNSVVDEPLPDSFDQLLKKLDDDGAK